MKRYRTGMTVLPAAALAMALLSTSCEKERPVEWDYFNTNIVIDARNADGDPYVDLSKRVLIRYDDEVFRLIVPDLGTRAEGQIDMPEWEGFRWNRLFGDRLRLVFGEFSVDTRNYRGETFTIDWGDGTTDEITFDLYATGGNKGKEPVVHQSIWVNGELSSDNSLTATFVK